VKLILTLLVRDEVDIIRQNILYHLNQGVDFVIATDNGSKDGTKEILHEFVNQKVLKYIYESEYSHSQSKWVTQMLDIAREEFAADLVINSDADEFWWPKKGNLKSVLDNVRPNNAVLYVQRNDFMPVKDQTKSIFERMIIRDTSGLNGIGRPLPPKIITRPIEGFTISAGNHDVENFSMFRRYKKAKFENIEILHFPMRSYAQFAKKIEQGAQALLNFHENLTATRVWLVLYEKLKAGTLEEYYYSRVGLKNVEDSRLRDFMKFREII